MMQDSVEHISDEILEAFARGALADADRNRVLEHVRQCSECRRALIAESSLAEGIRLAGRAGLRQRLAARLAEPRPSPIPWVRISGIAAAIVVIAGIGITYHWLSLAPELSDEKLVTTSVPPPAAVNEPQQEIARQARIPKSDAPVMMRKDTDEKKAKANGIDALAAAAPADQRTDALTQESYRQENEVPRPSAAGEPGKSGFQGVAPTLNGVATRGKIEESFAVTVSQHPDVVIRQSLADRDAIRDAGRLVSRSTIPARIVSGTDTLFVTLFPDSLFDENDLRNARPEFPQPDSLVLQIGTVRLGYRLPQARR